MLIQPYSKENDFYCDYFVVDFFLDELEWQQIPIVVRLYCSGVIIMVI